MLKPKCCVQTRYILANLHPFCFTLHSLGRSLLPLPFPRCCPTDFPPTWPLLCVLPSLPPSFLSFVHPSWLPDCLSPFLPNCLPHCLPGCLPVWLPAWLPVLLPSFPAFLTYLLAYLRTYLRPYWLACLLPYSLTTFLACLLCCLCLCVLFPLLTCLFVCFCLCLLVFVWANYIWRWKWGTVRNGRRVHAFIHNCCRARWQTSQLWMHVQWGLRR